MIAPPGLPYYPTPLYPQGNVPYPAPATGYPAGAYHYQQLPYWQPSEIVTSEVLPPSPEAQIQVQSDEQPTAPIATVWEAPSGDRLEFQEQSPVNELPMPTLPKIRMAPVMEEGDRLDWHQPSESTGNWRDFFDRNKWILVVTGGIAAAIAAGAMCVKPQSIDYSKVKKLAQPALEALPDPVI